MLAKNSDLLLFASSAASLAAVFFWMLSRRFDTIWLICVLSESISPLASTVMNRLKSPSIAAAEICAKPRTCVVRLPAMVFTDTLSRAVSADRRDGGDGEAERRDVRDLLPDTLDVADLGLAAQLALGSDLTRDLLDLGREDGQLVDHAVDGVHEVEDLARDRDTGDLLRQIALRDGALEEDG